MSNILVFVEARDGALKKPSLEALSLGRELAGAAGGEAHALLIGSGVEALAPEVAKYGAAKVHVIDSAELALYTGDGYAAAMESVICPVAAPSSSSPRTARWARTFCRALPPSRAPAWSRTRRA
jgi:electron transfer flavoprotein alpha subunit